jgi:hypothetical protein
MQEHPLQLSSIWGQAAACSSPTPAEAAQAEGQGNCSSGESLDSHPVAQEFSTWKYRSTGESQRIIDHVWCGGLGFVRRWRMPSTEEIGPCGLPSSTYASDHLAVCADLAYLD